MVEAFAVASGKGGTGKTTGTLALGMALAEAYDVTVVDVDTGTANLLFHTGLEDAETTLHDLLIGGRELPAEAAVYERYGMRVVPCGTDLADFEAADPARLREVVTELAASRTFLERQAGEHAVRSMARPVRLQWDDHNWSEIPHSPERESPTEERTNRSTGDGKLASVGTA